MTFLELVQDHLPSSMLGARPIAWQPVLNWDAIRVFIEGREEPVIVTGRALIANAITESAIPVPFRPAPLLPAPPPDMRTDSDLGIPVRETFASRITEATVMTGGAPGAIKTRTEAEKRRDAMLGGAPFRQPVLPATYETRAEEALRYQGLQYAGEFNGAPLYIDPNMRPNDPPVLVNWREMYRHKP